MNFVKYAPRADVHIHDDCGVDVRNPLFVKEIIYDYDFFKRLEEPYIDGEVLSTCVDCLLRNI